MGADLEDWVFERLAADPKVTNEVSDFVLAALDGDDSLATYLDTGHAEAIERVRQDAGSAVEPPAAGAFLAGLSVEGFRGIGERVAIDLTPGPGLTIIAGRNGSGKSTLAEGLEVALTGSTYRWKNRTSQWREQWRNLHHGEPARVIVTIAEEGRGLTRLTTTWASGGDVADMSTSVQRPGGKLEDRSVLGWTDALATYRPLMSYEELGGVFEGGPSGLYDMLAVALGMEQISDAVKRLDAAGKELKRPGDELSARRKALLSRAESIDDERAVAAAMLLEKVQSDVDGLTGLAVGASASIPGPLTQLRSLAELDVPTAQEVAAASNALMSAVSGMVAAGEQELRKEADRFALLETALVLHERHGDMLCPVCQKGELDAVWADSRRQTLSRRDEKLEGLRKAQADLESARGAARRLISPRPRSLDQAGSDAVGEGIAEARRCWDIWQAAPEDDTGLARHLTQHHQALSDAVARARALAAGELQARQDQWAPFAADLGGFCEQYRSWEQSQPRAAAAAAAVKWLKAHDNELKNERLAPIAQQARAAWALLRHESNVDIESLTLAGTATRRHVAIQATVDGESAGALAVMSQGELHALSLALFLPRAQIDESPFRFVVLDDPVQAMDPAKVDGLVQLLAGIAERRQVIVLSHDDRLPAAARRAKVGARILEVTRAVGSRVAVTSSVDPAGRYLSDARALTKDKNLPDKTMRRTLPGLLRFAVEAAAHDAVFARGLRRGARIDELEDTWSSCRLTRDRVSLAVSDDLSSLDSWLTPTRSYRRRALGVVTSGMHNGLGQGTPPMNAVEDVEKMVDDLRQLTI